MQEKFCLKWNDFQTNVTKKFSSFKADTNFCDVTLVSDDQKQISAHKIVLSSCSEYFKNILKQNKHAHPLLCLAEINFEDLTNVIDYIYHGEVQIFQDDLDRFLNVAQRLKLDGLLTPQSNEVKHETFNQNYEDDTHFVSNDNPEAKLVIEETVIDQQRNLNKAVSIPEDSSMDDVKLKVLENLEKDENGNSRCKLCGTVMTGRNRNYNMKKHIETHIDGISHSCRICGKQFRSSNSLSVHKSIFHR